MKLLDFTKVEAIKSWLGAGSINILGRPFAGKDTQGTFLSYMLDAPLIGSGDILRNSNDERVKKIIGTGVLAPTEDFLAIVTPYLAQPQFDGKPLVLSSVGRWSGEQVSIIESAKDSGHPIKAVVHLKLSEQQVRDRYQAAHSKGDRGSREDDLHGKLDIRLKEFNNKTLPVIKYYREHGLLIEVDGNQTPEQVSDDIVDALYARALV